MDEANEPFTVPEELPVLPLRDLVVFPYMVLPLFVARERSIAAIEEAMAGDRLVLLTAQREGDTEEPEPDDLHKVAKSLLEYETLTGEEVKTLLEGGTIDRSDDSDSGVSGQRSSVPSSGKPKKAGDSPGGLEPEPQPGS